MSARETIRPLERADLPAVIAVHRQAWGHSANVPDALVRQYSEWLTAVFIDNPLRVAGREPLVVEVGGQVVGFFGAVQSDASLNGELLPGAVMSNFVMHPAWKGQGLGLKLLSATIANAPDVAFIDEANSATRSLWERAGGVVSLPQCVRWLLPLRPVENVLSLGRARLPSPAFWLASLVARPIDAALRRVAHSPYRFDRPALDAEPLTVVGLDKLLAEFGPTDWLRPVPTNNATEWFIARARGMTHNGELVMTALRNVRGDTVGWYVYYANAGGQGEVLQLVAEPKLAAQVLDHLAYDASQRGVCSLAGTLHPDFLPPLAHRFAQFERDPRWMLVYSRRPKVLEAFWRSATLVSRIQGEWSHHFR